MVGGEVMNGNTHWHLMCCNPSLERRQTSSALYCFLIYGCLAESCRGPDAGKDVRLAALAAFLCIFRYFIFDPTLLSKNLVKSILQMHVDLGRLVATCLCDIPDIIL